MSPKTLMIGLSVSAGANLMNACDLAVRPPSSASWWLIALSVAAAAISVLLASQMWDDFYVAVCERLRQLARTEATKELRP